MLTATPDEQPAAMRNAVEAEETCTRRQEASWGNEALIELLGHVRAIGHKMASQRSSGSGVNVLTSNAISTAK